MALGLCDQAAVGTRKGPQNQGRAEDKVPQASTLQTQWEERETIMLELVVGIILLILVFTLPMPYALWLLGLIAGILLVVYGVWVLFRGGTARTGSRRYW